MSEELTLEKQKLPANSDFTEAEIAVIDKKATELDITNSAAILNYGTESQNRIASFSESALSNVRNKDMGEVGDMISDLITQLKNFDVDQNEKGIKAFFKKTVNKAEEFKVRYSKVETNVDTIAGVLEKHQATLMEDISMLDTMYEKNLQYFKDLSIDIAAGKKKLEDVRNNDLVELQKKAEESGLPEDAQRAKDLAGQCDRFEKKLYDLELTRTIALQTAPQIRMVQNSDTLMVEKIQSTIVNTIPLWKNQMVIALGIQHAGEASKAERQVNDMTNELLRKNADKLKMATIEAAKESERGIVDIETLQHTNESLISTLDEVMSIQKEGKEKRKAAESELVKIEDQLKDKLLEASQRQ